MPRNITKDGMKKQDDMAELFPKAADGDASHSRKTKDHGIPRNSIA